MPRSGYADLPLHYGRVPIWLAEGMTKLGGAIVEALVIEYGKFIPKPFFNEVVRKEREDSYKYDGMTVLGKAQRPSSEKNQQLKLF